MEDEGKQEEKFEFTPEGEVLGYISLDQARVLSMRTASESPGAYGRRLADTPMAFDVVEADETEDYDGITISYKPAGGISGRARVKKGLYKISPQSGHRRLRNPPQKRPSNGFPSRTPRSGANPLTKTNPTAP